MYKVLFLFNCKDCNNYYQSDKEGWQNLKVIYLINILLNPQCKRVGEPPFHIGGWIEGIIDGMSTFDIDITVCSVSPRISELIIFSDNDCQYAIIPDDTNMQDNFRALLGIVNPDLVHILGTEMRHSLEMMKVCNPTKTLVQIQGLAGVIAPKYKVGIPEFFFKPRDLSSTNNYGRSLYIEQRSLELAGEREREVLKMARHILGHTTWDQIHAHQLAPNAQYHKFPETLRKPFYSGHWKYENCYPYSIFLSQAGSPIKGAHMLLRVLPDMIKQYPDLHLYIAGFCPPYNKETSLRFETIEYYDYYRYLRSIIKANDLKDYVTFLGMINAERMKEAFLRSNVFVSCSIIENESNSLSEAKILGVPSVASYVGGVIDRVGHGIDGFLYPYEEPEILRYYISKIFDDQQLAQNLSNASASSAHELHDPIIAAKVLWNIYNSVLCKNNHLTEI